MKVRVALESFAADRQNYQPYKPVFKPVNVTRVGGDNPSDYTVYNGWEDPAWYVEVEVSDKEVRREGDSFVFTPKGLEIAIQEVAKIFDRVHQQYLKELGE